MDVDYIETWLRQKALKRSLGRAFLAVGALVFGMVILFVTFWLIYGVIFIGFNWIIPLSHVVRWWITLVVVILLFVGNARTSRDYLTEYSFTTHNPDDKPVFLYIPGVGMASNINHLAPDSVHSYAKIITTLLYSAPRMFMHVVMNTRKSYQLATLDVKECAAVIAFLFKARKNVSFIDIASKLPSLDFNRVFTELRYIDGVLFLAKEPPGLVLNSSIIKEIQCS